MNLLLAINDFLTNEDTVASFSVPPPIHPHYYI